MRTSKRIYPYRDGYIRFVKRLDANVSSFGAPKNTRTEADVETVVELACDKMTHRQRDLEFAYNMDKDMDLKVRCPYHPAVTNRLQAINEGTLYDVYEVDADPNNMTMFVYMQENRKL